MRAPTLVPASDAARRLGVKRPTLYAYVSRGLLASRTQPGRRGSWFDPAQLDALVARARAPQERRPDFRLTSAITLIDRGRYFYRGLAPEVLAASQAFETVAEFLWTGAELIPPDRWPTLDGAVGHARSAVQALPVSATPTDQLRLVVAVLGARDPLRIDMRHSGAVATARRLVAGAVAAVARRPRGPIAAQVASWLGVRRGNRKAVAAIDSVLVMMADHEIAASTLAVRVAASFGADPYAAVSAGLAALSGARHGAASRPLEQVFADVGRGRLPGDAVRPLLLESHAVPGFGHPLYPDGDPRVPPILRWARALGDTGPADQVAATLRQQGLPAPNVDFALATFTHALGLRPGAGEKLFTAARLVGWLAHAMEEYAGRSDFRMRAVYVGPRPEAH